MGQGCYWRTPVMLSPFWNSRMDSALYRLTSKTYRDSTRVEYAYDLAGKV